MEIGVSNGENAQTMVKVATKNFPSEEVEYYGFDYFLNSDFKEVELKLEKSGCKFKLFRGDTTETLPKAIETLPKMDLIFIDGGKSYQEAKSDWENSKTLMHKDTYVFVHNYEFPGVRRMVDSIPKDKYKVKIIHPQLDCDTALIKKIPNT
jgi:predicted O-methyltransferase YrrM